MGADGATYERDGTSLAFEDHGAGEPALVFVHGWTCNRTHWGPQLAHFGREHRVVAVDLRGHGASGAPEQEYTIPGFADDVAELCARLELDRPVLVGHSMGGTVVLEVAASRPGLARGVVMIDAAPIVPDPAMVAMEAELHAALEGESADATRATIVEMTTTGFTDDPELGARIRREMSATPWHVARSCLGAAGAWDGETAARRSAVPMLHIGADDPINDAGTLRALNPLLRTGQTVGGGHFNHLQVPEQVNAMMERFLAGLD